jgi:hypothetical protein
VSRACTEAGVSPQTAASAFMDYPEQDAKLIEELVRVLKYQINVARLLRISNKYGSLILNKFLTKSVTTLK